ncbi:MAG: polyprenyl synthetase family protein [Pirellulales bacterium]|nr:polyprenyl synthetase family protein [Pirellulales bacterium]
MSPEFSSHVESEEPTVGDVANLSPDAPVADVLRTCRGIVDSELRRLTEFLAEPGKFGRSCPADLKKAIRYSLLAPGKRLRPAIVLLAAEASGGDVAAALPAACAVEMIHTYSLIHDDLPAMDDDDLRRGLPTCHRVFGEAMAILAGDALLALAFQTVSETRPLNVAAECCAALASAAGPEALVGGQVDDLASETADEHSPEQLQAIHSRKTAAMFAVSARLGAMAAQAPARQITDLEEYGYALGLAFQVTDDLLDVQGKEAKVGKRVGKDSDRGKLTYPGLLGEAESRRWAKDWIDDACARVQSLNNPRRLEALAQTVLERDR